MCTSHTCKPRCADDLRGELRQYLGALALQTLIVAVTVVGGLLSGGLTLLADAPHATSDLIGFIVSAGAVWIMRIGGVKYERLIRGFGGIINYVLLTAFVMRVAIETVLRMSSNPTPVNNVLLFVFALCALVLNCIQRHRLAHYKVACHNHHSTLSSLIAHSILDIGTNVVALISALAMSVTANYRLDTYLTGLVVLIMIWFMIGLFRDIQADLHPHFT